jgi:hypothetical protein
VRGGSNVPIVAVKAVNKKRSWKKLKKTAVLSDKSYGAWAVWLRSALMSGVSLQRQAINKHVLGCAVAKSDGEEERRRGRKRRRR